MKWNPTKNAVEKYDAYPPQFKVCDFNFTLIYLSNNRVNMIPAKSNMGLSVDLNNKIISNLGVPELENANVITFMFRVGSWLYLEIEKNNKKTSVQFNTEDNSLSVVDDWCLDNSSEFSKLFIEASTKSSQIIKESSSFGLNEFIVGIN